MGVEDSLKESQAGDGQGKPGRDPGLAAAPCGGDTARSEARALRGGAGARGRGKHDT